MHPLDKIPVVKFGVQFHIKGNKTGNKISRLCDKGTVTFPPNGMLCRKTQNEHSVRN